MDFQRAEIGDAVGSIINWAFKGKMATYCDGLDRDPGQVAIRFKEQMEKDIEEGRM